MNADEARDFVNAARNRGLGSRSRPQRVGAVLWSAFLGACCTLAIVLLMPEDWVTAPITMDRLALTFMIAWAVSLVPALSASLLATPPQPVADDDAS